MLELPLSQYRTHGNLIFISGQVGIGADGEIHEGLERQVELAMNALLNALKSAGSGPGHLLKTTAYLRRREDFAAMNEIYARFVPQPWPARTTLVTDLVLPGLEFEIEAIARPAPGPDR